MIFGNPYKFAIITDVVDRWNIDRSFDNGVLIFCVDGRTFPGELVNATLNYEIPDLKERLGNIGVDERLFNLPKDEAFVQLYNIRFPEDWDVDEDYRFDISPTAFSDIGCQIFAVSNGSEVRILASRELEYITAESRCDLSKLDISETLVSVDEIGDIISRMNIRD